MFSIKLKLALSLYNTHIINHNNKQYSGSEIELLLRLECALNVENEFHFATCYKFCRWWQEKLSYKLSKCNKTASFRPIPRWGERLRPLVSQPPPPSGNAAPSSGCPLAPPLNVTKYYQPFLRRHS